MSLTDRPKNCATDSSSPTKAKNSSCERYVRREDGTILVADYPVGCPQRPGRFRWLGILIVRALILANVLEIVAVWAMFRPSSPEVLRINRANFDRIRPGMTKAEVEAIFGCPPGNFSHRYPIIWGDAVACACCPRREQWWWQSDRATRHRRTGQNWASPRKNLQKLPPETLSERFDRIRVGP